MGFELSQCGDMELQNELKKREGKEEEPKEGVNGWSMICAKCGVHSTVPFKPNTKWDVFCYECYKDRRDKK